jgi:hypothetical protein
MEALRKIGQAKYHLDMMKAVDPSSDDFLFNLVSFISSGREVTWYLQKEFAGNPKFKEWYAMKQQQMKEDEEFTFFRDKRNIVVKQAFPEVKGYTTDYVKFFYINGEGKVAQGSCWAHPSAQPMDIIVPGGVVTIAPDRATAKTSLNTILQRIEYWTEYFFEERLGRPIVHLCEKYLANLEKLCTDWANKENKNGR